MFKAFKILLVILRKKKYAIIASTATLGIGAISYYLTVININRKSLVFYAEMNGVFFTITSLILGLVIALLGGAYISLLVFKREAVKTRAAGNKAAGLSGAITGFLASGCPSCGAPILGFLGFPLALMSLPFKGLELKILSVLLLSLSIFLISENIQKNLICQRSKNV